MPHESGNPLSSLDPHAPLVLDTRALSRQPGSSKGKLLSVPAPENFGGEMLGVPEGAAIELDVRLEAVLEGVLITGTATVPLEGECARCLDPIAFDFEADFQELFVYPDTRSGGNAGDDELRLDDDLIDLEPLLRDAVVLALPLSPLCQDDCSCLCTECGARLADAGPDHHHDVADPRWAALQGLTGDVPRSNAETEPGSPGKGSGG
jgi:uncharacterized protein